MIEIAAIVLTAGLLLYIFTATRAESAETKDRATYLRERKDAVYENLRDLSFEYKAGKLSEADYEGQRNLLETEAGAILAEIDRLEAAPAR
jgi:hypothetical protein